MNDPWGGAIFDPGAWLAGFIKRITTHCYSEKIFFMFFPFVSLWELMTPRVAAIFDLRGMAGRIYKEDHYTLLHTK